MATGFSSSPGKLRTPLAPEGRLTGNRPFKIDIPLKPGDSGGPIVDAYGNLVGINSAVEFLIPLETAIFIDSEGNRPNTRKIASIIARDRGYAVEPNSPNANPEAHNSTTFGRLVFVTLPIGLQAGKW